MIKQLLTPELLTNKTNRNQLLLFIFNRLNEPKYQAIYNYIVHNILELKLSNDQWSDIIISKTEHFVFFQQMVLQSNQVNLTKLITLITTLDERTKIQVICGMINYQDTKNHLDYTPVFVKNITTALAFIDKKIRGLFLSPRDEDGQNLLAYAVKCDQPLLVKLILDYFECAQEEDHLFLSDPTYLPQDNEKIHLYIIQNPKLYSSASKINDLELLALLTKTKNSNGQNCLELAIFENITKKLRQLLLLIKKLSPENQQEIIGQLSLDAKEKLMGNPDYQEFLLPRGTKPETQEGQDHVNPKASPMFFRPKSAPVDKKESLKRTLFPHKEWP
jgi:hypothetical protein